MQFIIFSDDVGAEFTSARTTRKEIVTTDYKKMIRFTPVSIAPVEVIDAKSTAGRAAGGFLLLGPLGAALGVLTAKGPQVLFELVDADGFKRKGVIAQQEYGRLRAAVERMQAYQSGDLAKKLAKIAAFSVLLLLFGAAGGPVGIAVLVALWFGGGALLKRSKARRAAA